jgi:hypothetical protein
MLILRAREILALGINLARVEDGIYEPAVHMKLLIGE